MAFQFAAGGATNFPFIGDGSTSDLTVELTGYPITGPWGGSFTIKSNNLPAAILTPGLSGPNGNLAVVTTTLIGTLLTFSATRDGSPFVYTSGVAYAFSGTLVFNNLITP